MKKSLIEEADERVSIVKVCRLIDMNVPEGGYGKHRCPFGDVNHSDGGVEPSFRIYTETNSAYCFACRKYFSPVHLYAEAKDKRRSQAALDLLEFIGWKPVSRAQRWAEIIAPEVTVDLSMLALALRTYCARICREWEEYQFIPEVTELFSKCLALLDRVRTPEDAEQWLETCKQVMRKKLEAAHDDR